MDETKLIQQLAASANRSQPPAFDPVAGVLGKIRSHEPPPAPIPFFGALATLSTAAMVALAAWTVLTWQAFDDPVAQIIHLVDVIPT